MERSEILDAMGGLKLFGMRAAYDEIVATAVSPLERCQAVTRLAVLLMEAAGAAETERDDDER